MKTFTKITRLLALAAIVMGSQATIFGAQAAAPVVPAAMSADELAAINAAQKSIRDQLDGVGHLKAKKAVQSAAAVPAVVAAPAAPALPIAVPISDAVMPAGPVVVAQAEPGFLGRVASWLQWAGSKAVSGVKSVAQGTWNKVKNYADNNDAPVAKAINALRENPVGTVASATASAARAVGNTAVKAAQYVAKKVNFASAENPDQALAHNDHDLATFPSNSAPADAKAIADRPAAAATPTVDTKHVAAVTAPVTAQPTVPAAPAKSAIKAPTNDGLLARLVAWFRSFMPGDKPADKPAKKVRFADQPTIIPADPVVVAEPAVAMPVAVAPIAVPVAPVVASPAAAAPATPTTPVATAPQHVAQQPQQVRTKKTVQARPAVAKRNVVARNKANQRRRVRRYYVVRGNYGRRRRVQQRRRGGYRRNVRRARARNHR